MRVIDADALIEFCAERWIPLNIDAVNMQPTIQPEKVQLSQEGTTSDLISRQAVIDELRKFKPEIIPYEKARIYVEKTVETMYDRIVELPSIQPEPQWIPIERELPRDGSWNIFTDGKNISVERYKADAIDHFFPNGRWFQLEDVIAWMPLPEPYQKGEQHE